MLNNQNNHNIFADQCEDGSNKSTVEQREFIKNLETLTQEQIRKIEDCSTLITSTIEKMLQDAEEFSRICKKESNAHTKLPITKEKKPRRKTSKK